MLRRHPRARTLTWLALAAATTTTQLLAQPVAGDTRLLAQPAISADHVSFVYADDLWVADLDGSNPRRLTSFPGAETEPAFSPDGKQIAFTGSYDGNEDVYVVPVSGGSPTRLTWHPGPDVVRGWTPDGQAVLFTSPAEVFTRRFTQFYTVPAAGGFPTRLPVPNGHRGALSPDGKLLAYNPLSEAFGQWKNYRGGRNSRLWVLDLADLSVDSVPQPDSRCNDYDPMWVDGTGKLYFLSDRDGEFNLYALDRSSGKIERLTQHDDFPIESASAGDGKIAYEQAGYLHIFDPAAGTSKRLPISVSADLVETRPRYVSGASYVRDASLSPTGKRVALEVRGEIVSIPAEKGDPRNLTETTGAHERSPAWSPDGKSIAYFWIDLESGKVEPIATEPIYGPVNTMSLAWSPDSKWIAYTLTEKTYFQTLWLYSLAEKKGHRVTNELAEAAGPTFDASGKYLYFLASTDAGPVKQWFDLSNTDMESSSAIYLAVLPSDIPSPLEKESDEEAQDEKKDENKDDAKDEKKDDAKDEKKDDAKDEKKDDAPAVKVELDGLEFRVLALPIDPGDLANLTAGTEGQIYFIRRGSGEGAKSSLRKFDLKTRKEEPVAEGVDGFIVSNDRKKIAYVAGESWGVTDLGPEFSPGKGTLDLDRVQVRIDPRDEWPQIFREAWRINRDYFYATNYHGADWNAIRQKYEPFLPHLATRQDLNRVIRWMCAELAVGHSYLGGGDRAFEPKNVPVGLLGADYEIADGRYRLKKVYGGLNWDRSLRSPLTGPGVSAKAGEYLLAVDGEDLRPPANLYQRFENKADRIVELTIGPNADGSGSRVVKVVPIADESALRNRDWIEGNVHKVHEATDGRVAYVYVPNTSGLGHESFKRYFFPQADRDAIIVDERFNGGGQVADYYIDLLRRPLVSYWAMRYGQVLKTPGASIQGPKVMIIDETAGSGGDLLPWMFRKFELGPLVGRRTWGGLVGILGFPVLMDGGQVTSPNLAFVTPEGQWSVENEGVAPDVEVEQWPADVAAGHDPQLEKAIELIKKKLEESPPTRFQLPEFPVRVR